MLPEIPSVFDPLLINAGASVAWAILTSLLIELVPGFAKWWDKVVPDYKRMIRGWVGLLLSVLTVVVLHYMDVVTVVVEGSRWLVLIFQVGAGWLMFVFGAQGFYELVKPLFPRKLPEERKPDAYKV